MLMLLALALPADPTHTYTWISGSLTGHDAIPPLNLTLKACVGITFKAPTQSPAGLVQAYFRSGPTGAPWQIPGPWQTYLRADDFPQYPGPAAEVMKTAPWDRPRNLWRAT